jgi:protein-tyrosine-phosphatase/predicted ATP-grasp superfamily ATP-dependent carboligase
MAIARSLSRHKIPVAVADVSGRERPTSSRRIARFIRLPGCDEREAFIEALCSAVAREGYDTIVPCSDAGLVAVCDHYYRLREMLRVGCPTPDVVASVLDKSKTLDVAKRCNISVPKLYRVPDLAVLDSLRMELRFPIIAKPISRAADAHHVVKMRYFVDFQSLKDAFLFDSNFGVTNLVQEYVEGEGVGVELLLDGGQVVAIFQHRRIRELPVTGGGSVTAISEPVDPLLAEQATRLLRELRWEGPAMVEFRRNPRTKATVLMEVNGRYWGSLALSIRAGVDFPLYEWQLAHGLRPAVPASYPVGLRFHWLRGHVLRTRSIFTERADDGFPRPSRVSELSGLVRDSCEWKCPAIWSWSDPVPALVELRASIRELSSALKRRIASCRRLFEHETLSCLRLRVARYFQLKRAFPPSNISAIQFVLFVCNGNIIRSPMAEAILRARLAQSFCTTVFSVCSAGILPMPGRWADERARLVAQEFGISLEEHRSRCITPQLLQRADLIVCMDYLNEVRILAMCPDVKRKLLLLGWCSDGYATGTEIPDPFLGSMADIRHCYGRVDFHTRQLADALLAETRASSRKLRNEPANASAA